MLLFCIAQGEPLPANHNCISVHGRGAPDGCLVWMLKSNILTHALRWSSYGTFWYLGIRLLFDRLVHTCGELVDVVAQYK